MMSNDNPNSENDPQNELRDMIQILPEEAIGWPGDGSGMDDLADFQANNWDGE
jgi:hypothetical protein